VVIGMHYTSHVTSRRGMTGSVERDGKKYKST
jgi:hypothetical protein